MNKYIGLSIVALGLTFTSCNDFLDTTPDNRATIDSEEKVEKLLVSAYSTASYVYFCEAMSDNFDDYGEANPNTDRFVDEVYAWKDVTEDDNESPERYWTGAYDAIIQANQALEAIGNVGNSRNMQEARAEALLSRAYHHFMLVNIFAKNYNSATSDTDPGVPYLGGVEDKLDEHHERASVATVYQMIDRDLQEALPLVGSDYMSVPKYHFNPKAAYAFAARFYLFYEKWDLALKYANLCLGANAASQIRNWQAWSQIGTDREVQFNDWIDASHNANLLLMTAYSELGVYFGPWTYRKRYTHGSYLADNETCNAANVFGVGYSHYYVPAARFAGNNYNFVVWYKSPYLFEETDPVNRTGFAHTVYAALTSDEVLLTRAEAYIMLNEYDKAAADLNTWAHSISSTTTTLTADYIKDFYNSVGYSYDALDQDGNVVGVDGTISTIKKHLHPAFTIDEEGSTQEAMLQCVLGFRRIQFLQEGLRWFDIKRYGIEIPRRVIAADGTPVPDGVYDWLTVNDERRAVQIPPRVRDSGIEANPR